MKGSRLVRGPIVVLAARGPNPLPPVRTSPWHLKPLPQPELLRAGTSNTIKGVINQTGVLDVASNRFGPPP